MTSTSILPPLPSAHVVHHPYVEIRSGSPYVAGTGIPVRRLFAWHRKGVSVSTLVARYEKSLRGQAWVLVLDALSFAYDNRELVEADLERERSILLGATHAPSGRRIDPTHLGRTFFAWLAPGSGSAP